MRKALAALAAGTLVAAGTVVSDARAQGADVERGTRCTFFVVEAGGFFIGETIVLVRQPNGAVTFTCRADNPAGVVAPDGALVVEIECFSGTRTSEGRVIVTPAGDLIGHCTIGPS
jgi:hypothetical protein